MLRYRQQSRRDHVVSLLPPISIATSQPMTVEERIFSDTPPPMTYTGSFPSKVLRHLDKTTFYSTPTKGEEALVNKVMHDDMPKNDVTQPDSTADQTQRSNKSNKRVNTSSNKREQAKNNSIKSLPSVQRRCTSAPSLKDETTGEGLLEVGNLTAPSTPRPTLTPHHGNHMLTDSKNGKEQNKNGFQFELRGDGFGLHSSADENATQLPVARPNTRAASTPVDEQQQQQHLQQQQLQQQKQHYQHQQLQQHHPPLHKQQQQVQGSKARSLSVGQVQKQKPKFEIRAVGFSLSPREKPDNRNRTSTKPVETCLKTDPDKVEVDKLKSEQSDITVRIPVIANETTNNDNNNDGSGTNDNNNDGNDNDNNDHDNDKDKNNNSKFKNNDTKVIVDIDKGNGVNECDNNNNDVINNNALPSDNNNNDKANHEETNASQTNSEKPSDNLTTNKHNEEKEISTKKEKTKAQSKGQKNSKQHTKKK